ncbi:MAG: DNA-protecting protein DprA [Rhodanobacteraceae bacterium]|nr:DNA-protecting protein DprA [Rhodanobacteraceae bacterium]
MGGVVVSGGADARIRRSTQWPEDSVPDTRLDWLTLHRACATGAAQAWRALTAVSGDIVLAVQRMAVDALGAQAVARARDEAMLDLQWLTANDVALLTCSDERYPPLLRGIPGAPLLLFVRGDVDALWLPQLAVVGSRQGTAGGLATARDFAATLASRGFAVTSGLAAGIDAAAHQGALDAGGQTIAVLGTGLDRIYPARHVALARRIVEHGALVSEFPPRTPARRENFPRRNRIISGLSLGTLVVEASLGSGSLITARVASEQGREVFAIPGSIHNPLAKGCHQLIRDGAKLVETAQEVVDELAPMLGQLRAALPADPVSESPVPARMRVGALSQDADYRRLHAALGYDPVGIDALAERTGLTVPALSSMLLRMELEGEVVANPGGTYSRCAG